ncbi:MAG: SOS response-associated peptidase [Planctomycetales bacterium]|nr:SOS response-associated peptidase [bacterium]UNM07191.1 MAG: SOS response-associated peptidase [Planctomycetales bacterium]
MCGRFTMTRSLEDLMLRFDLEDASGVSLRPNYNTAPGQQIAVVHVEPGGRVLSMMRWGLIPSWAKDPAVGFRMINARSETAAEKPSFRSAFRRRRCIIPADGFYEWHKTTSGAKQPYLIGSQDQPLMALAGLWETWEDPESGDDVDSATILTTAANEFMSRIHDRMPVILPDAASEQRWLDPDSDPRALGDLLAQYPGSRLRMHAVSTDVNSTRNNRAELVEPIAAGSGGLFDGGGL